MRARVDKTYSEETNKLNRKISCDLESLSQKRQLQAKGYVSV